MQCGRDPPNLLGGRGKQCSCSLGNWIWLERGLGTTARAGAVPESCPVSCDAAWAG